MEGEEDLKRQYEIARMEYAEDWHREQQRIGHEGNEINVLDEKDFERWLDEELEQLRIEDAKERELKHKRDRRRRFICFLALIVLVLLAR